MVFFCVFQWLLPRGHQLLAENTGDRDDPEHALHQLGESKVADAVPSSLPLPLAAHRDLVLGQVKNTISLCCSLQVVSYLAKDDPSAPSGQ